MRDSSKKRSQCQKGHENDNGLDRAETRAQGQHDEDEGNDTMEAEISWLWVLQRLKDRHMEAKTSSGFSGQTQEEPQGTDCEAMVDRPQEESGEDKSADKRLDKLLCDMLNENSNGRNRRTPQDAAQNDNLEAVEGAIQKAVGTAEAGSR